MSGYCPDCGNTACICAELALGERARVQWVTTPLKVSVHLSSENPIWGESGTHIEIDDEAAGGFVVLTQDDKDGNEHKLVFDIDELELVTKRARVLVGLYDKRLAKGGAQ
jgi:hypothetical protein